MKKMLYKYIFFLACLFASFEVVAQFPDCPTCVPPPVGLPIDEGVLVMCVVALIFGFLKIYYSVIKKKGSI